MFGVNLQTVVHLAGSAPLLDGSRVSLTKDVDALRIEHAGRREKFAATVRETAREMSLNRTDEEAAWSGPSPVSR